MKELNCLVQEAIKNSPEHYIFKIPVIMQLDMDEAKKSSFSVTGLSTEQAFEEFYFLAYAALILISHKMNLERRMVPYIENKGVATARKNLRDTFKDEQTFLNSLRKTELIFYCTMLPLEKDESTKQENQKKLQTKLENPLHDLEQSDPQIRQVALFLTADQIALGDSYHRVENYCRVACRRLERITPRLPKACISEFTFEEKKLFSRFEGCCKQACTAYKGGDYQGALTFYFHAVIVIMKSKFAPIFDLDHQKWGDQIFTLTMNIAKITFLNEKSKKIPCEIIGRREPFFHAAKFTAMIRQDENGMVKLLNWERKQYLYQFFTSLNILETNTVTTIADYADDDPNTFQFLPK